MDYIPIARPINRWLKKSSGSTEIDIQGRRYSISTDDWDNVKEHEGGMGIAYECLIPSGFHGSSKTGYIKHLKLDTTLESELRKNLDEKNAQIKDEIDLQKIVHNLGYAPAVIGEGLFSALPEDPKFHLFIQEKAVGDSFHDLKDSLTIEERLDVLENYFFPAIQELHENNIYHSDLDVHHVFFDIETNRIEIIDWGGGLIAPENVTSVEPNVGGKGNYSPAEQKRTVNRIYYTPQSEIYSVGAVAYYFLRDDKNGEDDSADCFGDHEQYDVLNFDSQYEQSIPSSVANAIRKATTEDPSKRFQSMEEFMDAWKGGEKSNLTSLIVANREQVLSEINIENESFSYSNLNIAMVGSQHNPSWSVRGNFDYFMTEGSKAGQWRAAERLDIIDHPYIIRKDGEILLLDVRVVEYASDDAIEEEENEFRQFREIESGETYIDMGITDDNRTILRNSFGVDRYVSIEELNSRFIRI